MRQCLRFNRCSAPACPLNSEIQERIYIPGEDICPFTIKKRGKLQKGLITRAPDDVLKVIPESNLKMLNAGNLKRWHTLHQNHSKYA